MTLAKTTEVRRIVSRTTTHLSVCKKLVPLLDSTRAAIREDAATALGTVMDDHVGSSWLNFNKIAYEALSARAGGDGSAPVRKAAAVALRVLGFGLWYRCAYAEAVPCLDGVLSVLRSNTLARLCRWECLLALGDAQKASSDMQLVERASAKIESWPISFVSDMDPTPYFFEVVALGYARGASAHVEWAAGKDPCTERRKATKPPGTWTKEKHLRYAGELLERASRLVDASVEERLRKKGFARGQYACARVYEARARFEERSGDAQAALRDFRTALEIFLLVDREAWADDAKQGIARLERRLRSRRS